MRPRALARQSVGRAGTYLVVPLSLCPLRDLLLRAKHLFFAATQGIPGKGADCHTGARRINDAFRLVGTAHHRAIVIGRASPKEPARCPRFV
jgi:hypothetical protein